MSLSIEALLDYARIRLLRDLPNQETLQKLMLTFFDVFHSDGQQQLDELLARYDGGVIRVDATFASLKGLGAYVTPSEVIGSPRFLIPLLLLIQPLFPVVTPIATQGAAN